VNYLDEIKELIHHGKPVMGSRWDDVDGHALNHANSEATVFGRIILSADRFATHDPDVDWPSSNHDDPVDAICAALDRVREKPTVTA
jgi:hypothetical protein